MRHHGLTAENEAEQTFRRDILPLKDSIFRLALRITQDRDEADDIAQETLVRMWDGREQWPEVENMAAYCLAVCRRLAIDQTRRAKLHTLRQQDIARHMRDMADDGGHTDERMDIVRTLIDRLPEVQRTIMLLRDVEGMHYDEIAQVTGLTETQVRVYLHRARMRIKDSLASSNYFGFKVR